MSWMKLTGLRPVLAKNLNYCYIHRYIFTNFRLLQMKNYHATFKYFSYINLPLTILIVFYKPHLQQSGHLRRFVILTKVVIIIIEELISCSRKKLCGISIDSTNVWNLIIYCELQDLLSCHHSM